MLLMDKFDAAGAKGATVDVYWFYDEEDDTMRELGEEFGEDLDNATFHLEKMTGDVGRRSLCRRRASDLGG